MALSDGFAGDNNTEANNIFTAIEFFACSCLCIKNSTYDLQLGGNIIPAERLEIEYEEDKDLPKEALKAKQAGVSHLLIRRKQARNLHYAV